MLTHRVFLSWLLYMVAVIMIIGGLTAFGIPQLVIAHDASYLTSILFGLYCVAEAAAGVQAWLISREDSKTQAMTQWLDIHHVDSVSQTPAGIVIHTSDANTAPLVMPGCAAATHIRGMVNRVGSKMVDQSLMLDLLSERFHSQISLISFLAERIVWVGILATVLGVIMAFWPMLGAGAAIEVIRLKLGSFFAGIAVAFLPTAVSFVLKIALDISHFILASSVDRIVQSIGRATEASILPYVDAK